MAQDQVDTPEQIPTLLDLATEQPQDLELSAGEVGKPKDGPAPKTKTSSFVKKPTSDLRTRPGNETPAKKLFGYEE